LDQRASATSCGSFEGEGTSWDSGDSSLVTSTVVHRCPVCGSMRVVSVLVMVDPHGNRRTVLQIKVPPSNTVDPFRRDPWAVPVPRPTTRHHVWTVT
jgi:hypothetical protein